MLLMRTLKCFITECNIVMLCITFLKVFFFWRKVHPHMSNIFSRFTFFLLIILILSKLTEKHPHDTVKMAFIKEESEDIRIAEVFSIKHEDTETQTGWFLSQS